MKCVLKYILLLTCLLCDIISLHEAVSRQSDSPALEAAASLLH